MSQARPVADERHLLPMAPKLDAHPADGWRPATPYAMGSKARRAFRAIVRAMCPQGPAPQSADMVGRIEMHVLSFMMYMHPVAAKGLHLAILALDWAPRFLLKSTKRLHALDRRQANQIVGVLTESRVGILRTLGVAVRGVILSAYFDQPEVHQAIGYAPRPFINERIALRNQLLTVAPVAAE